MPYTKVQICNMALSNVGLHNIVVDIDNPTNSAEKCFNQYYDLVLHKVLKRERPQFALYDETLAPVAFADGTLHYVIPSYALEIVKINGQTEGWTIEHGEIMMLTSLPPMANATLNIKYLRDITDTGLFTDEFIELLAWELIGYCCGRLTQDSAMLQLAAAGAQGARKEYQTINLRSVKPRLKTKSKFDAMWRRI